MFHVVGSKHKNYFCPVCQKGVRKTKVLIRFDGLHGEQALLGCPKCGHEVMEMTDYIHWQLVRLGRAKAR